ncbi:hypothetical protein TrRE_jg4162 [Triparma retinervis]|uniref:Methyltransferase domain-containing protein n=1 Tax=Triparma retinervis TaxID=2557542 RepID=A0A9W6ZA80_9STRA|nr:hypothetical protein TrRE_jg4162 [Triparma retinervis]
MFGAAKKNEASPPPPIEVHDMCCGHGFTGMLFAACSPTLDVRVKLFDKTCPPSHLLIREAVERAAPHVKVIGVHACGSLTDAILQYAISNSATSIAVMPCCYTGTNPQAPYGLKRVFGSSWSSDIARSYLLSSNDYHTDFSSIPSLITPMNRIIVAERR